MDNLQVVATHVTFALSEPRQGVSSLDFLANVSFSIGPVPFCAQQLSGRYRSDSTVPVLLDGKSISYLQYLVSSADINLLTAGAFWTKIAHEIALEIILQNPPNDLTALPHGAYIKILDNQMAENEGDQASCRTRYQALAIAKSTPWIFRPEVRILRSLEAEASGADFTSLRWCVVIRTDGWRRQIYEFWKKFSGSWPKKY